MRIILITTLLFGLAGCVTQATIPVVGAFDKSTEKFLGSIVVSRESSGPISMNTQKGSTCSGTFTRKDTVTGLGTINCDDGRSGDFRFTYSGLQGEGFGKMQDGETFSFKFGDRHRPQQESAAANALSEALNTTARAISPPSVTTECQTIAGMTTCRSR